MPRGTQNSLCWLLKRGIVIFANLSDLKVPPMCNHSQPSEPVGYILSLGLEPRSTCMEASVPLDELMYGELTLCKLTAWVQSSGG